MATPNIASITFGDGLRFNSETYTLEVELENMTGDLIEFVFFKIIGQDEIYKLSTTDNITYSAEVPMERFSLTVYSMFMLFAYNLDGEIATTGFITIKDETISCVVKEGFGIEPLDWDDEGGLHTYLNPIEGTYINSLETKPESNYYAAPIETPADMKDDIYMMFMNNHTYTFINEGKMYMGLFEKEPDMTGVTYNGRVNFFGYKLVTDSSLTFMNIVVSLKYIDDGTVIEEEMTMDTVIDISDDLVMELYWDESDNMIIATLSRINAGLLEVVEKKYLELEDITPFNMDMFGVANELDSAAVIPYAFMQMNVKNFYLTVGKDVYEYPKIVTKTRIKTNYTPSDAQILVQYYDFETGEIVNSPNNILVEIVDKSEVVVTSLPGILRHDGWYEAYFDTLDVERDTYIVRITAEIGGKTYVFEELMSVQ